MPDTETVTERIPLDWKKSGITHQSELTQASLDGVHVGSITWLGGDDPWGIVIRHLPTRLVPKRKRYATADDARLAVEQHVNRWMRRMLNAARRAGWSE